MTQFLLEYGFVINIILPVTLAALMLISRRNKSSLVIALKVLFSILLFALNFMLFDFNPIGSTVMMGLSLLQLAGWVVELSDSNTEGLVPDK